MTGLNRRVFHQVVLISLACAGGLFSFAVSGAETGGSESEDRTDIEEIVVTGTRIKRRDFISPSPLATVDKQDLDFSGLPTLEGYLNQMPQVQPGHDRSSNNPGSGTAQINLRNLGPDRTLVMLNGRRLAPSGVGSAVDANNIPGVLVDRVEIITGGASTVYGSDAIAGVVNVITRNDFEGLSIEGTYNNTEKGDASISDVNLVYGHELASGRGHFTAYVGLYEREATFASDRKFTSIPWSDNWDTGEVVQSGSSRTPAGVVFGPRVDLGDGRLVNLSFNPDGTPKEFIRPDDLWNYAPVNYLQIPLRRKTIGLMGQFDITSNLEAYVEATFVRNRIKRNLAPAPLGSFLVTNIDNPLWSPEVVPLLQQMEVEPGLAGMFLGRRMLELGNRIFDTEKDFQRFVFGVRGEVFAGWELDAWVIDTRVDETESILNNGSVSRLQQALLVDPATGNCFDPSGGCVPADVFGEGRLSAAAVDFLRWQPLNNITKRSQSSASIVLTGAPFEIWSGPVDMAFGVEWRRDESEFEADPILFSGDVIAIGGDAPIDGTETVKEFYFEAAFTLLEDFPLGQKLDAEIGARFSEYDNAGSVDTWKAGLNWQMTDSLLMRSMFQHAVRAPNNYELFTEQGVFFTAVIGNNFNDPCSASSDPVAAGITHKCLAQGLTASQIGVFEAIEFYPAEIIFGGNPELIPESSDTFTVGFVYSPQAVPDLTLAIDYYDLEVTDTIGDIDVFDTCFDAVNTGGVFCDKVERDASGNINRLVELTQNRGVLSTDGIDVQVSYKADVPAPFALFNPHALLSVNMTWTHVFSMKDQQNVAARVMECNGLFGWPCNPPVNPENRLLTNINYASGPFTAHLTWRWIDGMDNAAPLGSGDFGYPDPNLAIPDIGSWSYFDLGFSYFLGDATSLRVGINNVTDKDPAFLADAVFSNNTSGSTYDLFGRSYYFGITHQFGSN